MQKTAATWWVNNEHETSGQCQFLINSTFILVSEWYWSNNSNSLSFNNLTSTQKIQILLNDKEYNDAIPAKHGSCGDCRNLAFTYEERTKMKKPTAVKSRQPLHYPEIFYCWNYDTIEIPMANLGFLPGLQSKQQVSTIHCNSERNGNIAILVPFLPFPVLPSLQSPDDFMKSAVVAHRRLALRILRLSVIVAEILIFLALTPISSCQSMMSV